MVGCEVARTLLFKNFTNFITRVIQMQIKFKVNVTSSFCEKFWTKTFVNMVFKTHVWRIGIFIIHCALLLIQNSYIYSKICTPFLTSHFKQKCRGTFFICSRQLLPYSFLAYNVKRIFLLSSPFRSVKKTYVPSSTSDFNIQVFLICLEWEFLSLLYFDII